jgi:hypothetical protein
MLIQGRKRISQCGKRRKNHVCKQFAQNECARNAITLPHVKGLDDNIVSNSDP